MTYIDNWGNWSRLGYICHIWLHQSDDFCMCIHLRHCRCYQRIRQVCNYILNTDDILYWGLRFNVANVYLYKFHRKFCSIPCHTQYMSRRYNRHYICIRRSRYKLYSLQSQWPNIDKLSIKNFLKTKRTSTLYTRESIYFLNW